LGPYEIEKQVSQNAYHLKLPDPMHRLHPVFNVVKLTPAPHDLIAGHHPKPPPPPELIEGEEEYLVQWLKKYWTVRCSTEDFASSSSGKDTAWNTIPGNMLRMSMHPSA
jgi:hypothetical protein